MFILFEGKTVGKFCQSTCSVKLGHVPLLLLDVLSAQPIFMYIFHFILVETRKKAQLLFKVVLKQDQ